MSDENVTSSVQDRYAPQFAQELARNEQEQKELEARLAQLREDHTALSGMLAALGHETTPRSEPETATPASVTDEAKAAGESVPQQRSSGKKPTTAKKSSVTNKASATKKTPAKKTTPKTATSKAATSDTATTNTATSNTATSNTATKAPSGKTATKAPGGPTLQDVIAGLLGGHSPERRTVREIFDELKQKHPERASSTQSVRNALNGLLRKGAIEREEKQGAVWFGTPATAAPTATSTAPSATTTPAAESADEKPKAPAEA
ncbi:hypothetical protein RCO28_09940 [Streptomyces sp. LHD-70]|uniref:hypothetical protein n=1 Tax=Streptomyces sp. LHD-70 TaxID=3072140 RepID=UPI0028103CAD|nr:hypothetical protein [Streptomyces sp. LHD-70]MDQ8702808.1 hypothetical protein [Streptomyces sp. LHD-70]